MKKKSKNNKSAILLLIFLMIIIFVIIANFPKGESVHTSKTSNETIEETELIAKEDYTPTPTAKKEILNELENGLPVLMYHFFYDKSLGER